MEPLTEDARALLGAPNIAHVATVMPDGSPHTVPTWVAVRNEHVVFLTGPGSRKARNIEGDPRVSLSLTEAGNRMRMVHLRGTVVDRLTGDEGWAVIDEMAQSYLGGPYPRGVDRVVFVVAPEHVTVHDFS